MHDTLPQMLQQSVALHEKRVVAIHKEQELSFSELQQQANALAGWLIAQGVQKGDRIAFYLEKRLEKVVAIFGIAAAGAVFVPIRRLLKGEQIFHILRDSGARILITTSSRLKELAPYAAELRALEQIVLLDQADGKSLAGCRPVSWQSALDAGKHSEQSERALIGQDLAAILYTSGSTGPPKGVVLSHLNITAGARKVAEYLKLTKDDRLLSILTFSFDYGLNQLTSACLVGARVVLLDYLFLGDILKAVERYRITGLAAVATTWVQLAQAEWKQRDLSSLRYITNSGGAIPEHYVLALQDALPETAIYLMYGLTEAFRSTYLDPALLRERPTSMGKVIPGEEVIIVNEHGRPVQPGETGELLHRGVLVAQGYWNAPEKTAQRFRRNPLQPESVPVQEMVVYSGDQVKIDEQGFLYFVGRTDEMIKCAGNRVSPTEIEDVLLRYDKISEAVVFGIPHAVYGQTVKAVIRPVPDLHIEQKEVVAYCKQWLPPYMIPSEIELRKEFPRHANGKLDRNRIRRTSRGKTRETAEAEATADS